MIQKKSNKTHDEFDLTAAETVYATTEKDLRGQTIAGPFDMFSVERLRNEHALRSGQPVPTDVFVFSEGEPKQRHLTKIGGLPYWPKNKPWPTTAAGDPCWFLAQLNFSDSRDLFPKLPGDLLTIYTEDEESWLHDGLETLHCVWQYVNDEPLISARQFPKFDFEFENVVCHGVIHRTFDYPKSVKKASKLSVRRSYLLAVVSGTKIGGVPNFLQGDPKLSGTFLAQIASVQPSIEVPYPWVNRKKPYGLSGRNSTNGSSFMIGDAGSIFLYLQKDGSIRAVDQCY